MPSTLWPSDSTRPSRSKAMSGSSSMIRTSVAISAASSRPDLLDQAAQGGGVHFEHLGGIGLREAFQRHQEKRLARPGGQIAQPFLDREATDDPIGVLVQRHRLPDLGKAAVQLHPRVSAAANDGGIFDQGLEDFRHIGVPRALAAGEGPRVPAQKGQMLSDDVRGRHRDTLPLIWPIIPRSNAGPEKKFPNCGTITAREALPRAKGVCPSGTGRAGRG